MCKPLLSKDDIAASDLLLLIFCKCFEDLYGEKYIKYTYTWPFSGLYQGLWTVIFNMTFLFERYNGILKVTPTHNSYLGIDDAEISHRHLKPICSSV